jgi:hypothetical protein
VVCFSVMGVTFEAEEVVRSVLSCERLNNVVGYTTFYSHVLEKVVYYATFLLTDSFPLR